MLYGEVFADKIDPPCGGVDEPSCITGNYFVKTIIQIIRKSKKDEFHYCYNQFVYAISR